MKTLQTYLNEGRMPLWQTDFNFLQESHREVLLAIINEMGMGKDNFIITGCSITLENGFVSMTSGWAYYRGEIIPVRALSATSYTGSNPIIYLTKTSNYDTDGDKGFVNSENSISIQHTYIDNYLAPAVATSQTTYYLDVQQGFWTLTDRLRHNVELAETDWIQSSVYEVYYKRVGRVVYLRGYVFNDALTGFNNDEVADVPIPDQGTLYFPGHFDTETIQVSSTGKLIVTALNNRVRIDHISYITQIVYSASFDKTYNIIDNGGISV